LRWFEFKLLNNSEQVFEAVEEEQAEASDMVGDVFWVSSLSNPVYH
jgi:hypothetical protein